MERSKAIITLESMRKRMDIFDTIAPTEERKEAIDLAIVSLKTDEAYNLMYEHADVQEIPTGSTTKNDLGVDCIDRQATLDAIIKRLGIKNETYLLEAERVIYQQILAMPSVTPQEPRIITCKDCKYYRNKGNKRSYCTKRLNVDSVTDRYREPNFYCADAVLREVEE
jgi:hypothetical protein